MYSTFLEVPPLKGWGLENHLFPIVDTSSNDCFSIVICSFSGESIDGRNTFSSHPRQQQVFSGALNGSISAWCIDRKRVSLVDQQ